MGWAFFLRALFGCCSLVVAMAAERFLQLSSEELKVCGHAGQSFFFKVKG